MKPCDCDQKKLMYVYKCNYEAWKDDFEDKRQVVITRSKKCNIQKVEIRNNLKHVVDMMTLNCKT